MKWSLNELRQTGAAPFEVDETIDLSESIRRRNENIIAISPVHVKGFLVVDSLGLLGSFQISAKLTVPSTRSLNEVELPLNFDVSEYYVDPREGNLARFAADDVVINVEDGLLDLAQVAEDNILLQIPMRVLTPTEQQGEAPLPQGQSWTVTEDDQQTDNDDHSQIDPRLAKLKDFFKKDD
ncbi:YceD family protein [Liquorilactobacillus satsumensis]|uniref:Nucleic acid-binding protein n=1 Tax=Liquorilactobacillus satsumensis DSM 16230 = JCM 12392 TaxID=1423801 RepID=A0A0R1V2I5_9LACO|nr:YceD family protein [Liquorilactobacillus satsumensis]KRL99849.1 hypothetical protein FD50_GL002384 [Liquorilactobacillus satsumensis DSM 16230 = JCM 12392]MCC7665661.1 DNA-binding protein [Liquorilactobacillus satsumensis]MCP9311873.1 DUF177 domain-containing protein [Liquorilactobacillus satsumensis]MCP9328327.1 DUF177 domain-containing protein [Liquorilactobacillus satsumensis]MCP9359006.1 DUF177 domain-containing protein [Liquorilactobacillus satsumensis]